MSTYQAPLQDIRFVLRSLQGLDQLRSSGRFTDLSEESIDDVLVEAARFSEQILAPLYHAADRQGPEFSAGHVRIPDDIKSAYRQFVEAGWPSLTGPAEFGGQGLPELVATPVGEMWRSANLAFALCPMLARAAVEALSQHGSEKLKATYLAKLVSGEWTGTMNLTESQAGSDLSLVQTTAQAEGDHYLIKGRKIFITWGDHDMSENIVHLVLARTPDAPEGVKGLSLFVTPKYLVNADGSIGPRNEIDTVSIERKLGIHASPTCVLSYGDDTGAIGYLVGRENDGLRCMFTMMNRARLAVGVEGLGVAERAYQQAASYARERVQGRPPGSDIGAAIVHHPDVRRMLLTMKSYLQAMRSLAYWGALNLDLGKVKVEEGSSDTAAVANRVALLTPIIKGWCTEVAQELVSIGLQVHGGAGYIEETGAAQLLRDVRITTIYEGTTAIQANDLVRRKLIGDEGQVLMQLLADIRAWLAEDAADPTLAPVFGGRLSQGIDSAADAAQLILARHRGDPALAGAVAVPFLMLLGTVLGGWQLGKCAQAAARQRPLETSAPARAYLEGQLALAWFYADHILPRAQGYGASVAAGSASVMALPVDQF